MVREFYIHPNFLGKWLHQNKAEYTGDYYDGVLLDNFVVQTKNGIAAIYEHYINPNKSDYLVKFERGTGIVVYDEFIGRALKAYSID